MSLHEESQLLTVTLPLPDLRHLPGYAGFRPQHKWRYGDTFGNDTAKYFQERRTIKLQQAKAQVPGTEWDGKVGFPTTYSNDPRLVLGARTRERNRWLATPKYHLLNHSAREDEIFDFDKKVQEHRRYLTDQSGTVPRVDYFVMPSKGGILPCIPTHPLLENSAVSEQERVTIRCPLCGKQAPKRTTNIRAHIQGHHHVPPKVTHPKSTWRDRKFRDFYFERR